MPLFHSHLHGGKWSQEEEMYAAALIEAFKAGEFPSEDIEQGKAMARLRTCRMDQCATAQIIWHQRSHRAPSRDYHCSQGPALGSTFPKSSCAHPNVFQKSSRGQTIMENKST